MKRFGLALAAAALSSILSPQVARAHAIESSLEVLPGRDHSLVLRSQFSSGEPAAGAAVELVAPGRQPIALGRTDATGQLHFARPSAAVLAKAPAWEVRIDQGPGHRDYLELPASVASSVPLAGWAGAGLLLIGAVALGHPRRGR